MTENVTCPNAESSAQLIGSPPRSVGDSAHHSPDGLRSRPRSGPMGRVGLVLAVMALAFLWTHLPESPKATQVLAQANKPGPHPSWDYTSVGVDLSSLPARLTDLGNDGWEVVSVLSTDAAVEQQADGKAHVVGQKVEVVAKRLRRP